MTVPRPPFGEAVPGNDWSRLDGRAPERLPTVSVIVVHYRQQAELDRTLAALARQTYPAELLEVVVVDDGSPSAPAVPPGVRLVRQADEGFRVAAARNLGVRESSGELLCFLDADTSPEPDYVRRLMRLPALTPEAVTVGRRRHAALDDVPPDADLAAIAPQHELPEPQWLIDAYAASRDLLDADDRSYRFVLGAVTATSRWFFEQVGGFDETFSDYGGEDWEWAHRAWVAGAVLAYVRSAVAWHDGPEWSGRSDDDDDRRRAKNDETLLLANKIGVAGSRGRFLRSAAPDVVLHLGSAPSATAAFVCVDSLLAVLPEATVVVPDEFAQVFGGDGRVRGREASDEASDPIRPPRVVVSAGGAVRASGSPEQLAELARCVAEVGVGGLGAVELMDAGGRTLLTVASHRAVARAERWGRGDLFSTRRVVAPWLVPLDEEPDVAAYLGGWG